jgi:hypothetical protein
MPQSDIIFGEQILSRNGGQYPDRILSTKIFALLIERSEMRTDHFPTFAVNHQAIPRSILYRNNLSLFCPNVCRAQYMNIICSTGYISFYVICIFRFAWRPLSWIKVHCQILFSLRIRARSILVIFLDFLYAWFSD